MAQSIAAMRYLEKYKTELEGVCVDNDIYTGPVNWQYRAFYDGSQKEALDYLNSSFSFDNCSPYRLRDDHLPTIAVGRLDGLLIVSANPGFKPGANEKEHRIRASRADINVDFCRYIFDQYPRHIGTVRYWTYALRMWAMHFAKQHQHLRSQELWKKAHEEQWEIGGIDLLPFHSSRDGVTRLMFQTERAMLKQVAKQTLKTVCSMPVSKSTTNYLRRRVVLVSSKAGARLVEELREEKALKLQCKKFGPPEWKMQLLEGIAGTVVVSLPFQVFSRATPPGYSRTVLAKYIGVAAAT